MYRPLTLSKLIAAVGLGVVAIMSSVTSARAQEKPTVPAASDTLPDFDPARLQDMRGKAPFRALDNPKMVVASESAAFLDDDEYVLGISIGGQFRAYPTRFVWFNHVVNDQITGADGKAIPFAITYCSVCNTGIAYDLLLDAAARKLEFYGLYNGIVALMDRESESVFMQAGGQFTKGTLKGKRLTDLPLLDTTWKQWRTMHPTTTVMSPDGPFSRYYRPKGKENAEPRGYDKFPNPFFAPSLPQAEDTRLPRFEKVFGVTAYGLGTRTAPASKPIYRAYPISVLQAGTGVLTEALGGLSLVILFDAQTTSAVAVSPVLDGKPVTLEATTAPDGTRTFTDKETGSHFTLDGEAIDGSLKGKRLLVLSAHLSQWYGWAATHPETSIHGKDSTVETAK